jgi:hypothetical protein
LRKTVSFGKSKRSKSKPKGSFNKVKKSVTKNSMIISGANLVTSIISMKTRKLHI